MCAFRYEGIEATEVKFVHFIQRPVLTYSHRNANSYLTEKIEKVTEIKYILKIHSNNNNTKK